ncbi:unnamed protein product, partial [marine sediment metagenome]
MGRNLFSPVERLCTDKTYSPPILVDQTAFEPTVNIEPRVLYIEVENR